MDGVVGRHRVEEAATAARAAAPEVEVETTVVVDRPAAALIAASDGARLVVLDSQGLGVFSGLLGAVAVTVAVAVAAHGKSLVVVVRDEIRPDGPVVVGVGGSPTREEAIAFAFAEASVLGAPLTAVIAWADFLVESAYHSRFTVDWAQVEDEQLRLLAERLAGWQEKYPDVHVDRVVVHDRPIRALLDVAKDARLLVVGSHGQGASPACCWAPPARPSSTTLPAVGLRSERAARPPRGTSRDAAQDRLGEPAVSVGADHEQVRLSGRLGQHGARVTGDGDLVNRRCARHGGADLLHDRVKVARRVPVAGFPGVPAPR